MIIKPQHSLSLLILASAAPLRADCDWADIAAAGLIGAGIGAACVYAASNADDSSSYVDSSCHYRSNRIKRAAENCYEKIAHTNRRLIDAYHAHAYDTTMHAVTRKGKEYQPNHWYISSAYRESECQDYAPLLRGYAALLNECEELRTHRNELVSYFGSGRAARYEYGNFDRLEGLLRTLQGIATMVEQHHLFAVTRDNFNGYKAQKAELARARRQLARAESELQARRAYTNAYSYYAESYPRDAVRYDFSVSFYN